MKNNFAEKMIAMACFLAKTEYMIRFLPLQELETIHISNKLNFSDVFVHSDGIGNQVNLA